jgi:hypothetical protein
MLALPVEPLSNRSKDDIGGKRSCRGSTTGTRWRAKKTCPQCISAEWTEIIPDVMRCQGTTSLIRAN